MASLYMPAPQREGLDWLSGLVRSGQNLWQNERQLQQAAQKIALAKQQHEIQTQQFWATQANLKRQEDFQNRKFMYGISEDERAAKRQGIQDERMWKNTIFDNELEQKKFNVDQDPTSIGNEYKAALTDNYRANAAQTRGETREAGGAFPRVTTYWHGETGTDSDYKNAFGDTINEGKVDKYSLALSPDQEKLVRENGAQPGDFLEVKLSDGNIVERRWDDRTSGRVAGRWDFHGGSKPDPNDGKGVTGFRVRGSDRSFIDIGPQKPVPTVEEHGGVKFVRFPRSASKGGDYFQIAPDKGGKEAAVTDEMIEKFDKLGLKFEKFTENGATFTRPKDTKAAAAAKSVTRDFTDTEGNKTTMQYDPETDTWRAPKVEGGGIKEQLLQGLK